MTRRGALISLLSLLLGGLLLAFLLLSDRQSSLPEERKLRPLTIAQFGDFFLYAPLYIAIDAEFFADLGLDISLVSTGGDEKTWAAVVSGDASFGVADPTFVAIAAERGSPGTVIASIVNGVPFWGVAINPAVPAISEPSDLSSLVVATFPAPSTAYSLQKRMFRDGGLDPRIREGSFGTLLPMLRAGEADIALELEPNVSQAVAGGAHVVYSMKDLYGDFAITGLTTTPRVLEDQTDLARDVVCALQYALDYLRQHPQESLAILAKRFPEIDQAVARAALERILREEIIPDNVTLSAEAWDAAINLRTSIGDLADPKPWLAYVNNAFAQRATRICRLRDK